MIASLHIADLSAFGALRAMRQAPRPAATPGLVYADALLGARLSASVLPKPSPGRVALFAVWDDDAALDRALADGRLDGGLAGAMALRLQPLRSSGAWRGIPPLVDAEPDAAQDEPVAVLTYGRLKAHRAAAFLRASARAEADALADPALLFSTGLTRPPRLVSTFSLWSSARAMQAFAYRGAGHTGALRDVRRRDFHRESIFLRFRPYGATGAWGELPAAARQPATAMTSLPRA